MKFVCTIMEEFSPPLVERTGEEAVVFLPIGYADDEPKSYLLMVTLSFVPGGDKELAFCIVEHDGELDADHCYWRSSDVARLLPAADRKVVLRALVAVTRYLLDAVRPTKVIMCTQEACLPKKALNKYKLICEAARRCGYDVSKYDEYHGQRIWKMERIEP